MTTTFAEGPERNKAMGVWAAIATGGAAVGLLVGGILVEFLSWPWIFFVNVPVGIIGGLARAPVRAGVARRRGTRPSTSRAPSP